MGIQALQKFIEANCPGACVPVDLLKIARNAAVRRPGGRGNPRSPAGNRLCLVVDGECCLDRLYGGYFSDWVCGGQWNRMVQFLSVLIQTIQNNNIELAVFFNGSLEPQRLEEWHRQQQAERRKVGQVLKHVATKATPPPKVWWIAPVCLRTCLRMALRHLNVTVLCSMDDHRQEVIAFCRENGFHGLMAEDAEYAIFDPPRYFSSAQLKLTYKGSLETREFILDEVARSLNLHPHRFCVLAALLGNYLLSEEELAPFHRSLCPEAKGKVIPPETLIPAVVGFVRGLPSTEDLDALGARVFPGAPREKVQRLKNCVHYYLNGTRDGFLRYRPSSQGRRHESGCYPAAATAASASAPLPPISEQQGTPVVNGKADAPSPSLDLSSPGEDGLSRSDPSKFASETAESELSSLTAYRQATGGGYPANGNVVNGAFKPGDALDALRRNSTEDDSPIAPDANGVLAPSSNGGGPPASPAVQVNGGPLVGPSSSSSNSSSPGRQSPKSWQARKGQKGGDQGGSGGEAAAGGTRGGFVMPETPKLPKVPPEVMRTASERHQKGLMSPWIYQLLSQGAIKIPVAIEDEAPRELPSGVALFRPIRQMVYAVLFNMHHLAFVARQKREAAAASASSADSSSKSKDGASTSAEGATASSSSSGESTKSGAPSAPAPVVVVEWLGRSSSSSNSKGQRSSRPYELVEGVQLGWPVPTVQRLWLGPSMDDKKCRLRAFLSCLRSDVPLMLNTAYVPQHLLIPCVVLRFLMTQGVPGGVPVLRRQELDAFLAQAVSPQLMDAQSTQGMQLPLVAVRGAQLAALFLQGVEHALFANDACGAPVPWLMCCPWLYFDGKLFHQKLLRAAQAKSLVEVCGGQIDQVAKVERMRAAILEGLQVEFARAPLPAMGGMPRFMPGYPPHGGPRMGGGPMGMGGPPPPPPRGPAGRGMPPPPPGGPRRGALLARGGQLEIAGVVVGSWGANYGQGPRGASGGPGSRGSGGRGPPLPPQVTSVGGRYGGMGRGLMPRRPMAFNRRPGAPFTQLNRRTNKKKTSKPGKEEPTPKLAGKGRGCTIETGDNCTIEVSQLPAPGLDTSGTSLDEDCAATTSTTAVTAPSLLIAGATVTESDTDGPLSSNGAVAGASEQFASV